MNERWAHLRWVLPTLVLFVAVAGVSLHRSGKLAPASGAGRDPVWVLLVGEAGMTRVNQELAGVAVAARDRGAVALPSGRVFAADHEAASRVLGLAGWSDRSLELYSAADLRVERPTAGRSAGRGSASAVISNLAGKSILTPGEALSLVGALQATQ